MINIALVHYPIYNKQKEIVATSIKNTDLHDISRICKTYRLNRFFVVNPLENMLKIMNRIKKHWTIGYGNKANPDRKEALEIIHPVKNIDEIYEKLGKNIVTFATTAKYFENSLTFGETGEIINQNLDKEILIFFGTGYGLIDDLINNVDYLIEPIQIYGNNSYNHLSVRSAVSIIIDRIYLKLLEINKEMKNGSY